jgi:hypothetical protein
MDNLLFTDTPCVRSGQEDTPRRTSPAAKLFFSDGIAACVARLVGLFLRCAGGQALGRNNSLCSMIKHSVRAQVLSSAEVSKWFSFFRSFSFFDSSLLLCLDE